MAEKSLVQAYSRLFHPIPSYSSLFQPFQSIAIYSIQFQPIPQSPFSIPKSPIWNAQLCILSPIGNFCVSSLLVHTISCCDLLLNFVKSDKYTLSKIQLKSQSQHSIRTRTFKSGQRKNILTYPER